MFTPTMKGTPSHGLGGSVGENHPAFGLNNATLPTKRNSLSMSGTGSGNSSLGVMGVTTPILSHAPPPPPPAPHPVPRIPISRRATISSTIPIPKSTSSNNNITSRRNSATIGINKQNIRNYALGDV